MDNFHSHFRFQPNINRIFVWSNKLRKIHLITLIGCIYLFFRFPSMNHYSTDLIQSSLPESSGSSMIYNLFEQAATSRCSSLLLLIPDNVHSYTSMSLLIISLYIISVLLSILAQWLYSCVSRDQVMKPYRWYRWCFKILICLVLTTICNQLVNALSCRPIEILYDIRYTSMLIKQIFGFLICLLLSFFLGIKYASIKQRR